MSDQTACVEQSLLAQEANTTKIDGNGMPSLSPFSTTFIIRSVIKTGEHTVELTDKNGKLCSFHFDAKPRE